METNKLLKVRKRNGNESSFTYVSQPPEFVTCKACSNVLNEPRMHAACGAKYCDRCIKDLINQVCPSKNCNKIIYPKTIVSPLYIQIEIDSLTVSCVECETKCKRINFQSHKERCKKCRCVNNIMLQDHSEKCEVKEFECISTDIGCNFRGTHSAVELHSKFCPYVTLRERLLNDNRQITKLSDRNAQLEAENTTLKLDVTKYLNLGDYNDKSTLNLEGLSPNFQDASNHNYTTNNSSPIPYGVTVTAPISDASEINFDSLFSNHYLFINHD